MPDAEKMMIHFVLKWGAMEFKGDPFPYNLDIIRRNGVYRKFTKEFVFWGKWYEEHPISGRPRLLEPGLQEPYGWREGNEICELANEAINDEPPVYLYLYNEFFRPSLTVANVIEAFYTGRQLPPPDEDGRPACAHIPSYYLHEKRERECLDCRDAVPRCKMRFTCNFWFKVTDFFFDIPQTDVQDEFHNLVYGDGQVAAKGTPYDPWGAASYPICVQLLEPRDFFDQKPLLKKLEILPRIICSEKFRKQLMGLENRRRPEVLKRLEQLSSCLVERSLFASPAGLGFKKLEGNPVPGSTHECYAYSDQDAKRLFGHFQGDSFVLDEIRTHLK